jgi:hypothetical protein
MATSLNAGFSNNINIIQSRVNGAHSLRYTDRAIDFDGDGTKEPVTLTHVSGHAVGTDSAPGGKTRTTVTTPVGVARSIVAEVTETDRGVTDDRIVTTEFTEGIS